MRGYRGSSCDFRPGEQCFHTRKRNKTFAHGLEIFYCFNNLIFYSYLAVISRKYVQHASWVHRMGWTWECDGRSGTGGHHQHPKEPGREQGGSWG